MTAQEQSIQQRTDRLHAGGIVDFHFDLLIDLYEKRDRPGVLVSHFLPEFEAGGIDVLGVAIYIEDRYLPEMGMRVALDQVARLYAEVEQTQRFAICKTFAEIEQARAANKIVLVITMEGVEPLGEDLNLLRAFYELGVRECERLGIVIDLAHINPKGFEDIVDLTSKPLIVSHTNVRKFYSIERNISDEQIKIIGQRGGVVGVNAILVSPDPETSTIDRYVDHIEHVIGLIGIDGVGIGFDFCEYLFQQLPEKVRNELAAKLTTPHFVPDLSNHSHAPNLTRRLIERGFTDDEIEKILRGNWLRIFEQIL